MTPAGRVRRRFKQGQFRKVNVKHTPLSAINAAVQEITKVLQYIEAKEPTLPLDCVQCGLVYVLNGKPHLRHIQADPNAFASLHDELTALPEFNCIGLIFAIQERVGFHVYAGGWVRPFIWSHETVDALGALLENYVSKILAQHDEVTK